MATGGSVHVRRSRMSAVISMDPPLEKLAPLDSALGRGFLWPYAIAFRQEENSDKWLEPLGKLTIWKLDSCQMHATWSESPLFRGNGAITTSVTRCVAEHSYPWGRDWFRVTKEGDMAAQAKNYDDQQWFQPVPAQGLQKLAEALENPKAPSEALKRLMAGTKESK